MNVLLLGLLLQPTPTPKPECVPDGCFMVLVQDRKRVPVAGVSVTLQVRDRTGTSISSDTGRARVCLAGVSYGDTATAVITPKPYRVEFPPDGQIGLVCATPSLWICKEQDCGVLSPSEVAQMIASLEAQNQAKTTAQIEKQFRDLAAEAQKRPETKPISDELLRRQMLITAVSRAEPFLSRWEERAREVLVRFERHAITAMTQSPKQPFEQMNEAFAKYNPVFEQLQEDGDTFVREVGTQWQPEISAGVQGLVEEARAIHRAEIYPLNQAKTLVNACVLKLPECSNKQATLARVTDASGLVRTRSIPALDRYAAHLASWKESVRTRLYEGDKP